MDNTAIGNNELFFELLCVAIGTRKTLSITPSAEQWTELFALSKKQALVAVAFTGVTRLNSASDYGASLGIPEVLYLKWLGMTAKIAQRNRTLNEECAKVCKDLVHDGFKTVVLKGQSNLEYYPEELRECRTPGDIDVWVKTPSFPLKGGGLGSNGSNCSNGIQIAVSDLDGTGAHYEYYKGRAAVVEYARMCARAKGVSENLLVRYHHVDMPVASGNEVEAHFMPMYLNNPFLNRRLQDFFERYGEPMTSSFTQWCQTPLCNFPMGTTSFNAVYQLTHIYKHLFEEGIGLRQLLDYYFVLRSWHNECADFSDRSQSMAQWAEGMGIGVLSKVEIQHWLHRLGVWRLAGAVMYVLKVVFDMPEVYMLREPDREAGEHLLEEIMMAGNFGKYDPRNGDLSYESSAHKFWRKTKRNLLLARFYPHEALWEPPFRLYHWVWRKLELWRF